MGLRLHILGTPVRQADAVHQAFINHSAKFERLMQDQGFETFLYRGESDAPLAWEPNRPEWVEFHREVITQIRERDEGHDVICTISGAASAPIAAALPKIPLVEYSIGYFGAISEHRVYQSYAWMHFKQGGMNDMMMNAYHAVIPNFFDVTEFPEGDGRGDYLLYIGRFNYPKGPHVAAQVAEEAGIKLIMVGPGVVSNHEGVVVGSDSLTIKGHEHLGEVTDEKRNELIAGARAVITPSLYAEPFGNVAVEAMLCGTPAIAPDWGAYPETVEHGIGGYRYRTLAEGIAAVERAKDLDREQVRAYAQRKFGFERIGPLYDAYFTQLETLWGKGWYDTEARTSLDRYASPQLPALC